MNISTLFFTAEGQAQSKKLARRKAAIVVLEEMKKVIEAEEKEKPQQECSLTMISSATFIRTIYIYTHFVHDSYLLTYSASTFFVLSPNVGRVRPYLKVSDESLDQYRQIN